MSDTHVTANPLPRWRGFNLLDFFTTRSTGDLAEDDLRWIRDWGFDFVRLPLCYLLWIEDNDPSRLHEPMLARIDRAVALCMRYGIHCNLSFHRGPGYSVNGEREEPFDLWTDSAALDAFRFHWETFARRYRGIPSTQLSFNLLNEPAAPGLVSPPCYRGMRRADHERVMRAAVAAIRRVDPERLIILDGLNWANEPVPELADLGVAQSCRAYSPFGISHYRANWVDRNAAFPAPEWPHGYQDGGPWTRATLEAHYGRWAALMARGVGVHCGEGGAFNLTPHDVSLRWFRDVLEVLQSCGIGWALWNFRGGFGILDSGRTDVAYADWYGHRLDRDYLTLLQQH